MGSDDGPENPMPVSKGDRADVSRLWNYHHDYVYGTVPLDGSIHSKSILVCDHAISAVGIGICLLFRS